EMAAALHERDIEERLAVDLEQVERGEDAPAAGATREGVALRVQLELPVVWEAVDEHAIEDRGARAGVGDDRVVQLSGSVHRSVVPDEARTVVAHPDKGPQALPLGLQDVAGRLRPPAG